MITKLGEEETNTQTTLGKVNKLVKGHPISMLALSGIGAAAGLKGLKYLIGKAANSNLKWLLKEKQRQFASMR